MRVVDLGSCDVDAPLDLLVTSMTAWQPALAGYPRAGLELVTTRVLDSRLVLLEYRPEIGARPQSPRTSKII